MEINLCYSKLDFVTEIFETAFMIIEALYI